MPKFPLIVLAALAVAVGSGCGLGPTTDGDPPVLILTAPTSDTVSGNFPITADAQDVSGIAKVRFSVDNSLLLDDDTAPYATSWETKAEGIHTIKVDATDRAGNSASVTKVIVVVDGRQ
jgi:hypothetical protein